MRDFLELCAFEIERWKTEVTKHISFVTVKAAE